MINRTFLQGILFAVGLSFFAGCLAQPFTPAPNKQSLLWEISGNGLPSPSYIFGTMHILCPQDAQLSHQTMEIIKQVNAIYLEVDLGDVAEIFGAMKAMAMQNGKTLKDLLTADEYQRVSAYFQNKSPLPFKLLERYKPLLLSSMVAESSLPCEAANGMELIIMEEANKWKKEIEGLETMSFQAGLFDSIPYDVQAQSLLKAIDSAGSSHAEIDALLTAYRNQDLAALEVLTLMDEGEVQGQADLLLYGRNRNWAAQFDTIANKQKVLIAVGAGHLPGEKGLLQLLRNKGYTLRPLLNEIVPTKNQTSRL